LEEYNTLVLLNGENFVYSNEAGTISAQPISSFPDITIDKNLIDSRISELDKVIKFLPYILPIITLFSVFMSFNVIVAQLPWPKQQPSLDRV